MKNTQGIQCRKIASGGLILIELKSLVGGEQQLKEETSCQQWLNWSQAVLSDTMLCVSGKLEGKVRGGFSKQGQCQCWMLLKQGGNMST